VTREHPVTVNIRGGPPRSRKNGETWGTRRDLGYPAFLQGEQSCTESRALTCHRKIGGDAVEKQSLQEHFGLLPQSGTIGLGRKKIRWIVDAARFSPIA
jgi:hypothetical protein